MDIDGGVVIARDLPAVPPAGLDALRLTHQAQRPATPRQARRASAAAAAPAAAIRGGTAALPPRRPAPGAPRRPAAGGAVRAQAFSGRWPAHSVSPCTASSAQAGAQPLDEPGGLMAGAAAVLTRLPQSLAVRLAGHGSLDTQLAGAHRFRQREPVELLAEQCRQTPHVARRGGEAHHAARRRDMPVLEAALELQHPALACREEGAEIGKQRRECGVSSWPDFPARS